MRKEDPVSFSEEIEGVKNTMRRNVQLQTELRI